MVSSKLKEEPPIAIIAGSGRLPLEIARSLLEQGRTVFVYAIKTEADSSLQQFPHEMLEWEQIGHLFKVLKSNRVQQVVLAGGVTGRPEFKLSKLDFGAMMTLPGLLGAMLGGDNAILSSVISVFEKKGFEVMSVADLAPELITAEGGLAGKKPSGSDLKLIREGINVCSALAPHDVGQSCVVVGKRVVAIEGVEGTDEMLKRVAHMRSIGRLPSKRGGIFVKALKLGQDERADLPAIGPDTVRHVQEAGLKGIAVQAGKTIILDRVNTLKSARENGLFVFGFVADGQGKNV